MNGTAVVKQRGEWWIGWIEEVPGVNAQESTKPELLTALREVLLEALEFNREEARRAAEGEFAEEPVAQASCLWGDRASRPVAGLRGEITGRDARWPHRQDARATSTEVDDHLARKICKDLDVPQP